MRSACWWWRRVAHRLRCNFRISRRCRAAVAAAQAEEPVALVAELVERVVGLAALAAEPVERAVGLVERAVGRVEPAVGLAARVVALADQAAARAISRSHRW